MAQLSSEIFNMDDMPSGGSYSNSKVQFEYILLLQLRAMNFAYSSGNKEAYVDAVDILEVTLWPYINSKQRGGQKTYHEILRAEKANLQKQLHSKNPDQTSENDQKEFKIALARAKHKLLMKLMDNSHSSIFQMVHTELLHYLS